MSINIRHKRGTKWSKMNTSKLTAIIDHPHYLGSTGVDYADFIDELSQELYRRQEAQAQKAHAKDLRQYEKHLKQIAQQAKKDNK